MKKFLFILIALMLSSSAFARGINLKCKSSGHFPLNHKDRTTYEKTYSTGIVVDILGANCTDKSGNPYSVSLGGSGFSLHVTNEYFVVKCPTVRTQRLKEALPSGEEGLSLGGGRLSAAVGGGASLGLYFTNHMGACFLAGVELGVGASAVGGGMAIAHGHDNFLDPTQF